MRDLKTHPLSQAELSETRGGIIVIAIGFFVIGVGVGFFAARRLFGRKREPRRL